MCQWKWMDKESLLCMIQGPTFVARAARYYQRSSQLESDPPSLPSKQRQCRFWNQTGLWRNFSNSFLNWHSKHCVQCSCVHKSQRRIHLVHRFLSNSWFGIRSFLKRTLLDGQVRLHLECRQFTVFWENNNWTNNKQSGHIECDHKKKFPRCRAVWSYCSYQQWKIHCQRRLGQTSMEIFNCTNSVMTIEKDSLLGIIERICN